MNETFFLAVLFAILAFTGVETGHAQTAKFCQSGYIADLLTGC